MASIKDILELGDFSKVVNSLSKDPIDRNIEQYRKQYEGKHKILDRLPKTIGSGSNKKIVDVAKLVITFQKKIVNLASSFLFGKPVSLVLNNQSTSLQRVFQYILDVWKSNKIDFFNVELARTVMIETKAAELWYFTPEKEIKVTLLCEKKGDVIYAHFDDYGDMDAFLRKYQTVDAKGQAIHHNDIYTADKIYYGTLTGGNWNVEEKANIIGKIPVIYYDQERPEWADVQTEIDRIENLISKFSDTNDYFGSPLLQIKGNVTAPPEKEDVGKTITVEGDINPNTGTVDYNGGIEFITWDRAPEAIEMEYKMLKDIIYSMTSTPDISFQNIKGTPNLSGIALKFLFTDALLKANMHHEVFGEGIERRLNVLKAMLGLIHLKDKKNIDDLDISITWGNILPSDLLETIKALSVSRAGDMIMSQETAVANNPFVKNAQEEMKTLEKEQGKLASLGESYKV